MSFIEVTSPIAEIIEEARNGRMFILVDDETRENEGDLVIPAQMATPDAINFMAKHGRGLICLAMTPEQLDELEILLTVSNNGSRFETAFCVGMRRSTVRPPESRPRYQLMSDSLPCAFTTASRTAIHTFARGSKLGNVKDG